jgi:DNA-binding beta-propeller fold protein YncE
VKPRFATFALVAVLGACSLAERSSPDRADLLWPPEDPKVRLWKMLETDSDLGRGRSFFDRLAGRPPAPLFERPFAAAFDGADLVVTDPGAARVVRLNASGSRIQSKPGAFTSPIGVALCRGELFVTDSAEGRIVELDRRLELRRSLAEGLARPTGIACDRDGALVVAETGAQRIVVFDPGGGRRVLGGRGADAGRFNFPTAVAIAPDGYWVGDTLNFRIQKVARDGKSLALFGELGDSSGQMPRIKGIATDTAGELWITDAHLDQVAIYRPDGVFLMTVGRSGTGRGEFRFPAGIAAGNGGKMAVVDSLNRRIVLFERLASDGKGAKS